MKKNLFLYLFVFAALIALYQFVSANKILNSNDTKISSLRTKVKTLEDSIQSVTIKALEMQYFSLENNDDALAYYEHLDIKDPSLYI